MRSYLDTELGGHAIVLDGPLDLTNQVIKNKTLAANFIGQHIGLAPGAVFKGSRGTVNGFENLQKLLTQPWPEAVPYIEKMVAEIMASGKLPEPASLKRKRRFAEEGETIEVDRALRGEPDFFEGMYRNSVKGPRSVAIITNIDTQGTASNGMVYDRSISAIAVAWILEAAGYSVEMWMWSLGKNIYQKPTHHSFTTTCVKKAGVPLDVSAVCDTLSRWFLYLGVFASFCISPFSQPISWGYQCPTLGEWEKYMDVTEGVIRLYQPITYGMPATIQSAIDMLTEVQQKQLGK